MQIENVEEEWQIQLPSGKTILTNQICKNCTVEVQKQLMTADLIVMDIIGFDGIFGMNWFS